MKKTMLVLFHFILLTGSFSLKAEPVVDRIKEDLEKCDLSIGIGFFKDVIDCLENNKNGQSEIDIKMRIKSGLALISCVQLDWKKIPDCINELSTYIVNIEQAEYRNIMICSPAMKITSFEDLENIGDNIPIFKCKRPFSDKPEDIEQELTKNDFINYVFGDEQEYKFVLVEDILFFYGIKELEIYFRYLKALYE